MQNTNDNSKQLTLLFHIGDLIIVHALREVVTKYIKLLKSEYGTKDPLTVTRVKYYEYLDITIDFSLKLGVLFLQYNFIKKIMSDLLNDLRGT